MVLRCLRKQLLLVGKVFRNGSGMGKEATWLENVRLADVRRSTRPGNPVLVRDLSAPDAAAADLLERVPRDLVGFLVIWAVLDS
jgi:hypothetical protein